jgi:UDP-N-acetylglucosamine--N-acetylmuramyl-(pentapeptide) pyrophosphoryl-undecaprenol N-acetylglucosamine transferase
MSVYAIACGGTGGHLGPGIAIAEELTSRGEKCLLIISEKPVDGVMMRKYGDFESLALPAKPLPRNAKVFCEFAKSQILSFFRCVGLMRKKNVRCVIGMGGFTNAPVVLAAFVTGRRIILHESNRIIGKTIRVLACMADRIFLPDGVKFRGKFLNKKVSHAAMPLRREICKIDKGKARKNLGMQIGGYVLTVIGGSQGADALNDWAYQNFRELNLNGISVCCIRGVKNREAEIIAGISGDGSDMVNSFLPFCNDMQSLLNATDLLLCRAGAGTIAEAAHCLLPMVLVPYPAAADNHQEANAVHAKKNGLAVVVRQNNMEILMDTILKCFAGNFENFKPASGWNGTVSAAVAIVDFAQGKKQTDHE